MLSGSLPDVGGWPEELLDRPPAGAGHAPRLHLHHSGERGEVVPVPVGRWHGPIPVEERRVLARAQSPVLDVGCGPGRHVAELARTGRRALGIDVSGAAVSAARRRGAPATRVSVFGDVPAEGTWATILLLDGNIGIGGDPLLLLARIHSLLAPGGAALIELDPPGARTGRFHAHVEHAGRIGPRFAWARVGPAEIGGLASKSGFAMAEQWDEAGRWFTRLDRLGGLRPGRCEARR